MGFIIGGHDTTSATLTWTVKHIAFAREAQATLRTHLQAAYPVAMAEKRNPTVDTLLGYHIPKGTEVFMMQNGPGYMSPPIPVDDSKRSESSINAKNLVGQWTPDEQDMKAFRPERWLTRGANGKDEFDSQAGPHLAFGLGPRGCYGRRLAYLQMRIVLVMMIWNFEFKETPAAVSSWAAANRLARHPQQCYVQLERVKL
jgi:cytochrome P450